MKARVAVGVLALTTGSALGQMDYAITTSSDGSSHPWIDATGGTQLTLGDDDFASIQWPFDFQAYDDLYTGGLDSLEINSNGSVHLDAGGPRTRWVNCGDTPSTFDGQWVAALGDDLDPSVGGTISWVVTGVAPSRVLTIDYDDVPEFSGGGVVDLQINFFEGTNAIVTQYREVVAPEFAFDGVIGVNAGDGVRGTEAYCGQNGDFPSTAFDVNYELVPAPSSALVVVLGTGLSARRRRC